MKRWILAAGMVLGAAAAAHANYILIIYNPGGASSSGGPGSGPGMIPGGPGTMMAPRPPGPGGSTSPSPSGSGSASPVGPAASGSSGAGPAMMGMTPPGTNPSGQPDDDVDTSSIYAQVVVEIKDVNVPVKKKYNLDQIRTKYNSGPKAGWITIYELDDITFAPILLPKVADRYKTELAKMDKKTAEEWLRLADWALKHGLLDEFLKNMSQLKIMDAGNQAVVALDKVQKEMDGNTTKGDTAGLWKERLGNYKDIQSAHYTLLYTPDKSSDTEIHDRLDRLEKNFRAFYYWFALKGKVLPVPDHRLVAVLVPTPEEFEAQRQAFDAPPMVADGFFSQRDDLFVLSADRLDNAYEALVQATRDMWSNGWNKSKLLNGEVRRDLLFVESVKAQMKALTLQAMKDESELATISYEGTRQLIASIGQLPPNVEAPRWITFGIGSFFETPKGAYWEGTGEPSWKYLPKWKAWEKAKKLDKAEEALKNVVTDQYFTLASAPPDPKDPAAADKALLKARTMSWSLTYYLAQRRLDGLLRYYQELSNLPRDMPFDQDVLMGCFARAFDLVDSTQPNEVNTAKLQKLAFDWYAEISGTPLEVDEAKNEILQRLQDMRDKRKGGVKPTNPMLTDPSKSP